MCINVINFSNLKCKKIDLHNCHQLLKSQINQEALRLGQAGIQVYGFGIGLSDKGEIESVASSEKNVFSYSDYGDLQQSGISLRAEIRACNVYVI